MKTIRNSALALALGTAAAIGSGAITGSAVRHGDYCAESGAYVPLFSNSAVTTLTIYPSTSGKRVLTYSASCRVDAPDGDIHSRVRLLIIVNGAIQLPAVGGFCTADGHALKYGMDRASITIPIDVVAGANTVRLRVVPYVSATRWCLADTSLVIHQ